MPSRMMKQCARPGCPNLVANGYCDEHKLAEIAESGNSLKPRASGAGRGYNSRWQKYRIAFLSENPFCVECLKLDPPIIKAATDVDHIVRVVNGQADPQFWNRKNHQALCHTHHSRKTMAENSLKPQTR